MSAENKGGKSVTTFKGETHFDIDSKRQDETKNTNGRVLVSAPFGEGELRGMRGMREGGWGRDLILDSRF